MFHLISSAWLAGTNDRGEGRDRMDHLALHEARIATDFRQHRADDAALARSQEQRQVRFPALSASEALPDLAACCA